jgi:choline dehydrogenase-like flavoprotein
MGSAESFDFVIVGAGSAGCVLKNRLSENPTTWVLLLEAGGSDGHLLVKIPIAWLPVSQQPRFTWGYRAEPETGTAGRALDQPRGKLLGGTSSINGQMYSRGNAGDYDGWEGLGLLGWSYSEVLRYFRRSESNWRGVSQYHGGSGPLSVIRNMQDHPLVPAIYKASRPLGFERFMRLDRFVAAGARWYLTGAGPLGAAPLSVQGYLRSDADHTWPDTQFQVSHVSMDARTWFPGWRAGAGDQFTATVMQLQPTGAAA